MTDGLIEDPNIGQLLKWAKGHVENREFIKAVSAIEEIADRSEDEIITDNKINDMISLLRECPKSIYRDVVRAKVFDLKGEQSKALDLLANLYYDARFDEESPEVRENMITTLLDVSKRYDSDWHRILNGNFPRNPKERSDIVLRSFYFGEAAVGKSCGKKVVEALRKIGNSQRVGKTITADDYYIKFLKIFSSATPIMKSKRIDAVGGGYFLAFGEYGCVIDPGHHFLDNFFKKNHSIDDVDAIIVTHFHDDHYADLPSLLSLLFQRWGKPQTKPDSKISLFCDQVTRERFKDLIDYSMDFIECITLSKHSEPIVITQSIMLQTLPTSHNVFGSRDTGVGLVFEAPECGSSLVITGDTAWTPELEGAYLDLKNGVSGKIIFVPHISSISENEIPSYSAKSNDFHHNHLCLRGLCEAIETLEPQAVLLSEVGEELESVIDRLAELIREVYGIKDCMWCKMGEEYTLIA